MSETNFPVKGYDFEYASNKKKMFEAYADYFFIRTQSMFAYEGLEDVPQDYLENYLQKNGDCIIAKHNGKLYALTGNAGGPLDEYFRPTIYTVANAALGIEKTFKIGVDCVYCKNDFAGIGLIPLICRYSGLMTENVLTIRLGEINMRMMNVFASEDDRTVASVNTFMNKIENGELSAVAEQAFIGSMKNVGGSVGSSDFMIQFIEMQQYLKGSLYNELGINANYNMKREALSANEISLNDDALMPLIDNMLNCRRDFCSEVNDLFGTEWEVNYSSSWHTNSMEKELYSQEELGGDAEEAKEFAGDEQVFDGEGVSQLTDDDDSKEDTEEKTQEDDEETKEEHDSTEDDEEETVVDDDKDDEKNNNTDEEDKDED